MNDWKNFIDSKGDFQLANFLFRNLNELMKSSLDMGTLLSSDSQKLRAYKEQTKKLFKSKWLNMAEALEFFEIIEKCECSIYDQEIYCEICKGSRYKISSYLSPDQIREVNTFVKTGQDLEVYEKLQKGLENVLQDT
jgi:hypothetical protein